MKMSSNELCLVWRSVKAMPSSLRRRSSAGMPALLKRLSELGIGFTDLQTRQSSLEDIFIDLVHQP